MKICVKPFVIAESYIGIFKRELSMAGRTRRDQEFDHAFFVPSKLIRSENLSSPYFLRSLMFLLLSLVLIVIFLIAGQAGPSSEGSVPLNSSRNRPVQIQNKIEEEGFPQFLWKRFKKSP
jgi:hypothetical protein